MNRIRRIASILTGLMCAGLGLAVAAPAAFAMPVPPHRVSNVTSPSQPPVQVHTMVVGGMPGWQITLIAIGAALVAAIAAVIFDRARTGRRGLATTVA